MSLFKKGQYFSFDAIVASIIFALAISILSTHWFALRAQINAADTYSQQEAYRISEVLLSQADPPNWYAPAQLLRASRAGLANDADLPNMLNLTTLQGLGNGILVGGDPTASDYRCKDTLGYFGQLQSLLSTGSNFWVEANVTTVSGPPISRNVLFGCVPPDLHSTQVVRVRRIVSVQEDAPAGSGNPPRYYWGNLTVFIWSKGSYS